MEPNSSNTAADTIIFFVAKWLYHPEISGLIPLPYAIPALMLDTFIGYILICYFKTPFYRLYLFSNTAQCAHWITSFYLYRASQTHLFYPLYAQIPSSGWIPTLLNFLGYYSVYLNFFFDWLLTVNRCTVFAFPFQYKTLWKRIMPYVILFGFSYPFIFTWHLIKTGATCTFIPTVGYSIDASEQLTGVSNSLYMVIFIAFYGVSVVAMNLFICCKIFQHRKRNESGNVATNQQSSDPELNLFLFTCINFLLVVLNRFLFQLYIFFNIKWMNDEQVIALLGLMMYPEDLSLCLTPLFLLLLCKGLREEIRRRFAKSSPDTDNSLFRTVGSGSRND
ncbi:serpentine type 7TM GPCR chemoreceptor sru domain-containing protein [Ditylenchus destructor]|uniref:Serpentine receptor class gamma n=1 Tax=Ditylenchus destructor TaxID=166010 RepID=A0AAD4MGC2_9BILA|nr:serpentine type 7TM GPCR chemoreceptor sru domain-containing protein [Ditylenchus destructor]